MTMSSLWKSSVAALLFLAIVCPSVLAQNEEAGAVVDVVEVVEGKPLQVWCELAVHAPALWSRDGAPLGDVGAGWTRAEIRRGDRLLGVLRAAQASRAHSGRYTCRAPPAPAVTVRVLPGGAGGASDLEDDGSGVVWYDVNRLLTLNCSSLRAANPTAVIAWYKNETEVNSLPVQVERKLVLKDNGALLEFTPRALEDDFGNYTCRTDNGSELRLSVRGRPHVKLPADSNVVEGQKLKLVCRVVGKPRPHVTWSYRKDTETEELVEGGRVQLRDSEQGVVDGELVLETAERTDAGEYVCRAGATNATTTVRVKDMYAALWPFLGICAEVFILCAIILVYERRRTKPDLEDSDADQDQKKS